MAEGILRHVASDQYEVLSAGTEPKGVHPKTVEVMNEIGIDITGQTSKPVTPFLGQTFDYIITVCDRAREHCPVFPGAASIHWSLDDPAAASPEEQLEVFRRVRDEIVQRIQVFVTASVL